MFDKKITFAFKQLIYLAGIYIHIPFCKTRCSYCDFNSGTRISLIAEYLEALHKEIRMRVNYLRGDSITTIYLGGGTPSLLSIEQLDGIFGQLIQKFDISEAKEITLECNPDDLTESYVSNLKQLPINRLSIGIQSFNDKELHAINRRHNARQAVKAIERCKKYGINNISADLIIGLPNQTRESFRQSITQLLSLNIQHVSVYLLSYEEGTELWRRCQTGVLRPMSDDLLLELFNYAREALTKEGFEHYEISNYAKKGFRSKHNSSYWASIPYLGLGSGAHSYNGYSRSWNVTDIQEYCSAVRTNDFFIEEELLSEQEKYNEFVMVSLRTKEGIDFSKIAPEYKTHFLDEIKPYLEQKMVEKVQNRYILTTEGLFLSDAIIRNLIFV